MITCIVWGAGGRMGGRCIKKILDDDRFKLSQAIDLCDQGCIGKDSGELHGYPRTGIPVRSYPVDPQTKGVVIEFSLPDGPACAAEWAMHNNWGLISGTTSLTKSDKHMLEKASEKIPVLWAPNFSLGILMLLKVIGDINTNLPDAFDVTIHESHHKMKKDRPSGTAKAIQQKITTSSDKRRFLDLSSSRASMIVGEHCVRFISPFEELTVSHRAFDRDVFVAGALEAANWLINQNPGYYSMNDFLTP